jgi:hypothetical protein
MKTRSLIIGIILVPLVCLAPGGRGDGRGGGGHFQPEARAAARESASGRTVVLGRPTDLKITACVLSDQSLRAYIEYGLFPGIYSQATLEADVPANQPVEFEVGELLPNSKYYDRLRHRPSGEGAFSADAESSFWTQRAPGSTFIFDIQADSHPERTQTMFDPELYTITLANVAADQPDFYITLGDDFSVDTLNDVTADSVVQLYINQRSFLEQVGRCAPLFLVNGNHEQAAAYLLDGTPNKVAVWAQVARNRFFTQPPPDGFYNGDETPVDFIGQLKDYYAWTWGDALFVVIDPYWHSPVPLDGAFGGGSKNTDKWAITLGEAQYRWLQTTLEQSGAKYKFVFAHHVLGTGRGGVELADQYEWGGYNSNGVWEFDKKRPGWEVPIHPLMAKSGVTIFFQGHDHLFVRQKLDGVIYQECPIPADFTYFAFNEDAYTSGVKLPNAGHLRVTVSNTDVRVEYIRSFLPGDETDGHKNGELAYGYSLNSKVKGGGIR